MDADKRGCFFLKNLQKVIVASSECLRLSFLSFFLCVLAPLRETFRFFTSGG